MVSKKLTRAYRKNMTRFHYSILNRKTMQPDLNVIEGKTVIKLCAPICSKNLFTLQRYLNK